MRKYQSECSSCFQVKLDGWAKDYLEVEKSGKCPRCGNVLLFNNSMCDSMWLQCRGYGMYRQPGDAECGYQILANRDAVARVKGR
jgi:hypothetical protein